MKKSYLLISLILAFALGACGPTTGPTAPTAAPTAVPTTAALPYVIQADSPLYSPHPNGCDGLYVLGGVFDKEGTPVIFMEVRLGGIMNGEPLYQESALSGSASQWGTSGYEIKISDSIAQTSGTVYIQLFDIETEQAVSDIIIFDTYNDCNQNVAIINIVESK